MAPRVRIAGLDAFEITGPSRPRGVLARDYLRGLLDGRLVYLETVTSRTGRPLRSFERYLVRVWIERDGKLVDVADLMIDAGHGAPRGAGR